MFHKISKALGGKVVIVMIVMVVTVVVAAILAVVECIKRVCHLAP